MIPNPLVDALFREGADGRRCIDLSTYVTGRGFSEIRLIEGTFREAARLTGDLVSAFNHRVNGASCG